MNSLSPMINSLHDAYCCAMNVELPMTMAYERWWRDAIPLGLTPDGVTICIEQRLKFNRGSTCKKGLMIHHLVRSEDDVAVVLNEIAVFKASQRVKVYSANKAQALRDVGLPDEPTTPDAKPAAELLNAYISQMKQAVDDATNRKAQ